MGVSFTPSQALVVMQVARGCKYEAVGFL